MLVHLDRRMVGRVHGTPGYGLEAHSTIGIGIQAKTSLHNVSACVLCVPR